MKTKTKIDCISSLALLFFAVAQNTMATDLDSVLPHSNTADGFQVLTNVTSGGSNSGFGYQALQFDSTGSENTAMGANALNGNVGGFANTAIGFDALGNNHNGR